MNGQAKTDDQNRAPADNEPLEAPAGSDADSLHASADVETLSKDDLLAMLEKERLAQDEEIAKLRDQVLRAHAEMENVRKRTEREKLDTAKYATTKFALDVVTIGDNLERAMQAAGKPDELSGEVKALYDGVALTSQELVKTLEKHGITRIPASGAMFDPHLHQAMMENPDASVPSGTILQVFQEGYTIGDRVLRPSMVVVARGGPKAEKPAAPAQAPLQDADPAPITPDDAPTRPEPGSSDTDGTA